VRAQVVQRAPDEPRAEAGVPPRLVHLGVEQDGRPVPERVLDPACELAVVPKLVAPLGRIVLDLVFVATVHPC